MDDGAHSVHVLALRFLKEFFCFLFACFSPFARRGKTARWTLAFQAPFCPVNPLISSFHRRKSVDGSSPFPFVHLDSERFRVLYLLKEILVHLFPSSRIASDNRGSRLRTSGHAALLGQLSIEETMHSNDFLDLSCTLIA